MVETMTRTRQQGMEEELQKQAQVRDRVLKEAEKNKLKQETIDRINQNKLAYRNQESQDKEEQALQMQVGLPQMGHTEDSQEKKQANDTKYDLIILDPPTFSNSKMSLNMLDINKKWSELVNDCLNLLNPKGVLYFSTNSRRLIFDSTLVLKQVGNSNVNISDITEETIPQDFKGTKIHRCWKIQLD